MDEAKRFSDGRSIVEEPVRVILTLTTDVSNVGCDLVHRSSLNLLQKKRRRNKT